MKRTLFVIIAVAVLVTGCSAGQDWKDTKNPIQQLEKAVLTRSEPTPAPANNYSAMEKQVRDYSGRACLETEAEFTGKQYICPEGRQACEQQWNGTGVVVIDEYGWVKCTNPNAK